MEEPTSHEVKIDVYAAEFVIEHPEKDNVRIPLWQYRLITSVMENEQIKIWK